MEKDSGRWRRTAMDGEGQRFMEKDSDSRLLSPARHSYAVPQTRKGCNTVRA